MDHWLDGFRARLRTWQSLLTASESLWMRTALNKT